MTALAEFLLSRLAEREQAARAAQGGPWDIEETDEHTAGGMEVRASHEAGRGTVCSGFMFRADRVHIALHDPAIVLAEVEAQRQILKLHSETPAGGGFCNTCAERMPCLTVKALALPHAAHPDYLREWAP